MVITGFSCPRVALYSHSGTTITYTSGMELAKGVNVSTTINTSSDTKFYADNQVQEVASARFTEGTFSMTVDGLSATAEKLIMGLPSADSDGFTSYGDGMTVPYVGLGFIVKYRKDGADKYKAMVLPKVTFDLINVSANTAEAEISFQTQALSGTILASDNATHDYFFVGSEKETEADALADINAKLSITG